MVYGCGGDIKWQQLFPATDWKSSHLLCICWIMDLTIGNRDPK